MSHKNNKEISKLFPSYFNVAALNLGGQNSSFDKRSVRIRDPSKIRANLKRGKLFTHII